MSPKIFCTTKACRFWNTAQDREWELNGVEPLKQDGRMLRAQKPMMRHIKLINSAVELFNNPLVS